MTHKLENFRKHRTKKDGRRVDVYYKEVGDRIDIMYTFWAGTTQWADFDTNGEQAKLKAEIKNGVVI